MSLLPAGSSLFGTYNELSREQRLRTVDFLHEAWRLQFARPLGSFSVDLEALAPFYAPTLTAKRLRSLADALPASRIRRPVLSGNLFIPIGDDRGFVTPEGRLLLEVTAPSGDVNALDERMLGALIDFYATPRRDWIARTFVGGDLRPATIGFVLFLLLNGSISDVRALRIPDSLEDEARLARAIIPVVNAFVEAVGAKPLSGRELTRLRSNWAVSEARAQLPGFVRSEDVDHARLIYIVEGQEANIINTLASALGRRRGFSLAALDSALEALARAYDHSRPLLLNWGLSWASDRSAQELTEALESATLRSLSLGAQ